MDFTEEISIPLRKQIWIWKYRIKQERGKQKFYQKKEKKNGDI